MNLLAVANDYPSERSPHMGVFLHVLMRDFQELGLNVLVLAPVTRFSLTNWHSPDVGVVDQVRVLRPRYVSFSNKVLPGGLSTYKLTVRSFERSVLRRVARSGFSPQFCYSHFLFPAGLTAQMLGQKFGVPSAVALGEGSFHHYEAHLGRANVKAALHGFSRIVAESNTLKDMCVTRHGVPEERIRVFRTAAPRSFQAVPQVVARRRLGLPLDRPVVAFVGHFDENKGPHRVLAAIRKRPDIGAIFLGKGKIRLDSDQVLFSGLVRHEDVAQWLSGADIMVQPSLVEASSYSLREAMACGLPLVTSDIPTLREYLDPSVSMFVDPRDIGQIRSAIETLIDDPDKRRAMGAAAMEKAKHFSSLDRAKKILDWFHSAPANP